jgi:hypothetical protein
MMGLKFHPIEASKNQKLPNQPSIKTRSFTNLIPVTISLKAKIINFKSS